MRRLDEDTMTLLVNALALITISIIGLVWWF